MMRRAGASHVEGPGRSLGSPQAEVDKKALGSVEVRHANAHVGEIGCFDGRHGCFVS
jgi:hypothetical protein